MSLRLALLFSFVCFCGCQGPAPAYDPFGAYGPRCVPPPPTGAIGTPTGYYQVPPTSTVPVQPLPGSTSRNPLQTVPSLSSRPQLNRTSRADDRNWQSGNPQAQLTSPPASSPIVRASASQPLPGELTQSDGLDWGRTVSSQPVTAAPYYPPNAGQPVAAPFYVPQPTIVAVPPPSAVSYVPPTYAATQPVVIYDGPAPAPTLPPNTLSAPYSYPPRPTYDSAIPGVAQRVDGWRPKARY